MFHNYFFNPRPLFTNTEASLKLYTYIILNFKCNHLLPHSPYDFSYSSCYLVSYFIERLNKISDSSRIFNCSWVSTNLPITFLSLTYYAKLKGFPTAYHLYFPLLSYIHKTTQIIKPVHPIYNYNLICSSVFWWCNKQGNLYIQVGIQAILRTSVYFQTLRANAGNTSVEPRLLPSTSHSNSLFLPNNAISHQKPRATLIHK